MMFFVASMNSFVDGKEIDKNRIEIAEIQSDVGGVLNISKQLNLNLSVSFEKSASITRENLEVYMSTVRLRHFPYIFHFAQHKNPSYKNILKGGDYHQSRVSCRNTSRNDR